MAVYTDGRYGTVQQVHLTGTAGKISVSGTAAGATTVDRFSALTEMRVLSARASILVGGTAAGPTLLLQKSVGGTGTASPFATCAFGTHADGTYKDFSVTETSFSSGDVMLVTIAAGTAASTPVVHVDVAWRETFA